MTGKQIAQETHELARQHWWNGGGVIVIGMLLVTFVWARPDNDYLLYVALGITVAHAWISTLRWGKERADQRHRQEIAVAYRKSLTVQEKPSGKDRPAVSGGSIPPRVPRFAPVPAYPVGAGTQASH